jgi:hypothetical protein
MSNIFWYYCVAVIGLALILYTLYKKKNILDLCSFFLAAVSFAYLLEVVGLFVFRSYDYIPGLYDDPIAESIYGHLVCNGFFWGGFLLLSAAFSLRFYWILVISAFFMAVEVFFLKKGLYIHHWWKLYYTGISVMLLLPITKKWLFWVSQKKYRLLRYMTFYLISWLLLTGPTIILLITGNQHFGIGLSNNYYLDDIYFDVPYHLILSYIPLFFINFLKKPHWKAVPFIIIPMCDFVLTSVNILSFHNGWSLFYLIQLRFLCLSLYIMLEKHTLLLDQSLPKPYWGQELL